MNHSLLFRATAVCALLAVPAFSQTDRVSPKQYANVWAGNNGSGTGIGVTGALTSRAQHVYLAPMPAGVMVTDVAFRRTANTTDYPAFTVDAEIALGSTSGLGLVSAFASNLPTDYTVVVPRAVYNIAAQPATSSPDQWIAFPLNAPFMFAGPDAFVDVINYASTNTGTPLRLDRCFPSSSGEGLTFGPNCGSATIGSSSSNSYLPGSTVDVSLSGAPANLPAALSTGVDCVSWNTIPLPFDLSFFGTAPGCYVYVAPILLTPQVTDGTGSTSVSITLPPDPLLSNSGTVFQWVYVDPASTGALQLAATSARLVTVGPRTCPENQYVYSFSASASTGSLSAGGPVVRFVTTP